MSLQWFLSEVMPTIGSAIVGSLIAFQLPNLQGFLNRYFQLANLHNDGHLDTAAVPCQLFRASSAIGITLGIVVWCIVRGCLRTPLRRAAPFRQLPFLTAALLLIFGSFYGISSAFGFFDYSPLPIDDALTANFQQHRAEFARLQTLLQTTTTLQPVYLNIQATAPPPIAAPNWSLPEDNQFRSDIKSISAYQACMTGDNRGAIFLLWSNGWSAPYDETKGYLYQPIPPTPILPSLDTTSSTAYVHLDGNWYLYYRHTKG